MMLEASDACLARDSRGIVLGAGQLREGRAQVLLLVAVAHLPGCATEAVQAIRLQLRASPLFSSDCIKKQSLQVSSVFGVM